MESSLNIMVDSGNWGRFRAKTNSPDFRLLRRLDDFPNAILIAGCQRSGTTMLSRVLRGSTDIVDHSFGADDELDGAMILAGLVDHEPQGRYCFQTTYVDQKYHEYLEHQGTYKMIWVLRNPYSTVYSLVYNWRSRALDLTFRHGASLSLTGADRWLYRFLDLRLFDRIKRACYLYNWKLSHLFELYPKLSSGELMVVDYDDLVLQKERVLPTLYTFVDLQFRKEYMNNIHVMSVNKKGNLAVNEIEMVQSLCESTYLEAQQFAR